MYLKKESKTGEVWVGYRRLYVTTKVLYLDCDNERPNFRETPKEKII